MDWQPIETAPKDGAEFAPRFGPPLLLSNTSGSRAIGYWDEEGRNPSGVRGWICLQAHRPLYTQRWTHWMPLPSPPSDRSESP